MRFLIDNNLSPWLAEHLTNVGHNAVHLRTYGLQGASHPEVMERARQEHRVLVSAGTDRRDDVKLIRVQECRPALGLV